jgi:exodeoxyribonuclease VII small subunit
MEPAHTNFDRGASEPAALDRGEPVQTGSPRGPTFEAALAEIQQVLESLEDGSVGLEESLQRFERGTALLRHCYELLESAERRIEILTGRDAQGQPVTAAFDSEATHQPEQPKAGRRPRRHGHGPPQPDDIAPDTGVRLF